jgi:3-oxosteroid 1-dehydrogenase
VTQPKAGRSRLSLAAFLEDAGVPLNADPLLGRLFDAPPEGSWTREVDVAIIGSGAAGSSAACMAVANGAEVVIVEKAAVYGGTSAFSGGVLHVYSNPSLAALEIDDPREEALRYLARVGFPATYRPKAPRYGVPYAEYRLLEAYYDRGAEILKRLRDIGAADISVPWLAWDGQMTPDYFAHLEENRVPRGRGVMIRTEDGLAGHGRELVSTLLRYARSNGADLLVRHQAVALVRDPGNGITGVICRSPSGEVVAIRTRRGVIFASGGITHSPELRRRMLRGPVIGGAGVATNTGDLVSIALAAGVQMGATSGGFWNQQVLELADDLTPSNLNVWFIPGDGVVLVDRRGTRVVNEKADYHNRAQIHHLWRGDEYVNQVLFMVYDRRTAEQYAGLYPIPPRDVVAPYVVDAPDAVQLQVRINERLREATASGLDLIPDVRLHRDFSIRLSQTIETFNEYARIGRDPEFARGEFPMDHAAHGPAAPDHTFPNATMHPLDASDGLYAVPLVGAAFETKCGPKVSSNAQMIGLDDVPIQGLYGAGNCVAGILGEGYPGGGATLGPAVVFGGIAAAHATGVEQ